MKTVIAILSLVLLLASCEDVIDIDLNSIEPQLVIEGSITNMLNGCEVRLTKTGDYFDLGIYPPVSDAAVSVSDQFGATFQFNETSPGIYLSEELRGIENSAYTLHVSAEGKDYEAVTELPQKVNIASLSFDETPVFMEFSGGYLVYTHLDDPAGINNYYRLKVFNLNDTLKGNKTLNVFNDDFVDGNEMMMQWDTEQFFPDDTVVVELQTIDESTYNYFSALVSLSEGGFIGSANPANPENNISNDALGFFGAYTVSRDTLVITSK
jgi:hypothetical protein